MAKTILFRVVLPSVHLREELDGIYLFQLSGYHHISTFPFLFKKSKAVTFSEQFLTQNCEVGTNLNSSRSKKSKKGLGILNTFSNPHDCNSRLKTRL